MIINETIHVANKHTFHNNNYPQYIMRTNTVYQYISVFSCVLKFIYNLLRRMVCGEHTNFKEIVEKLKKTLHTHIRLTISL